MHSSDSLNFSVTALNQNSKQKINKAQLAVFTASLICSVHFKVYFFLFATSMCSLLNCGLEKMIVIREFYEKEVNLACNCHRVQSFFINCCTVCLKDEIGFF